MDQRLAHTQSTAGHEDSRNQRTGRNLRLRHAVSLRERGDQVASRAVVIQPSDFTSCSAIALAVFVNLSKGFFSFITERLEAIGAVRNGLSAVRKLSLSGLMGACDFEDVVGLEPDRVVGDQVGPRSRPAHHHQRIDTVIQVLHHLAGMA